MTVVTQGQITDKPPGELIRELGEAGIAGALRLTRHRAKAVVYFDQGKPIFAASNNRAHRLTEFLKRAGLANDESLAQVSPTATDEEVLSLLTAQGKIKAAQATGIRANHVTDILRAILLWTEGEWQFDPRVRLAGEQRVAVDVPRLLLEATRHLPAAYIVSRFPDSNERLETSNSNGHSPALLPDEAFVASRLTSTMTIAELQTVSGLSAERTLRTIYGLAMAGAIRRSSWKTDARNGHAQDAGPPVRAESIEEFVARIDEAADYYAVLGVDRAVDTPVIKSAYHGLARQYHPDRFHQADARLRARIESAFAQVARAYETLTDATARSAYDAKLAGVTVAPRVSEPARQTPKTPQPQVRPANARAAASYQNGLAALENNQTQAVRFLAEAAHLEPHCARYRAEYGRALTKDPQTRRLAEVELKAAIALEPTNASYRVWLAELYQALGLRRRAEGELQRALLADPKSEAARTLLSSLKK